MPEKPTGMENLFGANGGEEIGVKKDLRRETSTPEDESMTEAEIQERKKAMDESHKRAFGEKTNWWSERD